MYYVFYHHKMPRDKVVQMYFTRILFGQCIIVLTAHEHIVGAQNCTVLQSVLVCCGIPRT